MSTIGKKVVKAGSRVSTRHVNEVVRNYKQHRWQHNSRRLGKQDSLSVWYSIAELEEFMETCRQKGADGIRMYFGAYGQEHLPDEQYAGRQTIVLVATKDKESDNTVFTKDLYVDGKNGPGLLAYNAGRVCPPFCQFDTDQIGIAIVDNGDKGMLIV